MKIWDGSAYVEPEVYEWDGSEFVKLWPAASPHQRWICWRFTYRAVSTIYNPVTGWVADSLTLRLFLGTTYCRVELDVVTITTNIDVTPLLGLVVELCRNGVTLASATWPGDAVRSVKTLTWTGAVAPDDEIYLVAN